MFKELIDLKIEEKAQEQKIKQAAIELRNTETDALLDTLLEVLKQGLEGYVDAEHRSISVLQRYGHTIEVRKARVCVHDLTAKTFRVQAEDIFYKTITLGEHLTFDETVKVLAEYSAEQIVKQKWVKQ